MRRRAALLMALMVATLVVASGVALPATISCPNREGNLCVGTEQGDTMTGTNRADDMRGRGGPDKMRARGGNDRLIGGSGNDTLNGAGGDDTYRFNDGWDFDLIGFESDGIDTLDFSMLANS